MQNFYSSGKWQGMRDQKMADLYIKDHCEQYVRELLSDGFDIAIVENPYNCIRKVAVCKRGVSHEETIPYRSHVENTLLYEAIRKCVNTVENKLHKLELNSVYGKKGENAMSTIYYEKTGKQVWMETNNPYREKNFYDVESLYPKNIILNMGRQQGKTELMNQARDFRTFMDFVFETHKREKEMNKMKIKDVIFNNPATIVFWEDGSKTVVKCQAGDIFDPEKGLAMAICKKAFGNKGNYCNIFAKWCEPVYEEAESLIDSIMLTSSAAIVSAADLRKLAESMKKYACDNGSGEAKDGDTETWSVWFREYDDNGDFYGEGTFDGYATKEAAIERACESFAPKRVPQGHINWIVSKTNPWGDK